MRGLVLNLTRVKMDLREMICVCNFLGLCSFDCFFDVRLDSSCIGSHSAAFVFFGWLCGCVFFSIVSITC